MCPWSVRLSLLSLYLVIVVLISVIVDVGRLYLCDIDVTSSFQCSNKVHQNAGRDILPGITVHVLEEILRQRGVQLPLPPHNHAVSAHTHYHIPSTISLPDQHLMLTNHTAEQISLVSDSAVNNHHLAHRSKPGKQRIMGYRQTLCSLIQHTGAVNVDEVIDIIDSKWYKTVSLETNVERDFAGKLLRSGSDLERLVLEKLGRDADSNSCLLVLIQLRGKVTLLERGAWNEVIHAMARFGIHAAIFDCAADPMTCERMNWAVPQLVLAIPRSREKEGFSDGSNNRASGILALSNDVAWHSLYNLHKTRQVIGWIRRQLASSVHRLKSGDLAKWSYFESQTRRAKEPRLRVLLVSTAEEPPILLSAIALRFRRRIQVGIIDTELAHLHKVVGTNESLDRSTSTYFILTPGPSPSNSCAVYRYGAERGEALSFHRLEIFLKFRLLEGHDLFTISLTLINLVLCIDIFIIESSCCSKHVISWLWRVAKYNLVLFVLWFIAVLLIQSQFLCMDWLTDNLLSVIIQNYFCNSFVGRLLIAHWPFLSSLWTLAISVFIFGSGVGLYSWRCIDRDNAQRQQNQSRQILLGGWNEPLATAYSLYPRYQTRISWIERRNQQSATLLNQLLRPLRPAQTSPSPRHLLASFHGLMAMPIIQNDFHEDPVHSHLAEPDCLNNLPSWTFAYANLSGAHLANVSEGHSEEKFETLLLEYAKFPAGMIPSLMCSICLERYHPASSDRRKCCGNVTDVTLNVLRSSKYNALGADRLGQDQSGISSAGSCLGDTLCGLPCGHNFHAHCVRAWLARDQHASCPICRWPCYKPKEQSPKKNADSSDEWDLSSPL